MSQGSLPRREALVFTPNRWFPPLCRAAKFHVCTTVIKIRHSQVASDRLWVEEDNRCTYGQGKARRIKRWISH
ncbi:hypothetical protein ABIE61_000855 [Marinobacterium sp. MBR-111]